MTFPTSPPPPPPHAEDGGLVGLLGDGGSAVQLKMGVVCVGLLEVVDQCLVLQLEPDQYGGVDQDDKEHSYREDRKVQN